MYCPNNSVRCLDQGYCGCHHERTAEAAGGCGGILFLIFVGIFAAFLYPAIRIFRSNIEYDNNDSPKFTGAVWLFTSPVFGFLAQMLYQLLFMFAAGAITGIEPKMTIIVFRIGMGVIYSLAMGLAVIAFSIKNREALKLFVTEARSRSIRKSIILVGSLVITALTVLAVAGIVFAAADGYYTIHAGIQNTGMKEKQLFVDETVNFDSYVGKYKFTTRSDKELFTIRKSNDGKTLRLNIGDGKNGKNEKTNDPGCLLSPIIEGNSVYYSVSNCEVNGKQSPLSKIYFKIENNKTKMIFIYNVRASSDKLEKIK